MPVMKTVPKPPGGIAWLKARSSNPMRMKMNPFNTNMRTSQTARACILVIGDTAALKYCRTCKPPATQANTADACSLFPHDPGDVGSQERNGNFRKTI